MKALAAVFLVACTRCAASTSSSLTDPSPTNQHLASKATEPFPEVEGAIAISNKATRSFPKAASPAISLIDPSPTQNLAEVDEAVAIAEKLDGETDSVKSLKQAAKARMLEDVLKSRKRKEADAEAKTKAKAIMAKEKADRLKIAKERLAEAERDDATDAAANTASAPSDESEESQVKADAADAEEAAETAHQAAKVATKVATHSVMMTEHAKAALKAAQEALHKAHVNSEGLSDEQKDKLKKAEQKLKDARKGADYGKVKQEAKYAKLDKKMKKMKEKDMKERRKVQDELEQMRKEIEALKRALKTNGDSSIDESLDDLEKDIAEMKKAERNADQKERNEMSSEVKRLREQINGFKKQKGVTPDGDDSKNFDLDKLMPYGDLEPFGREDKAQELTEESIKESDEMVDQLEKAEVAEEKRAVFRALTRLRGAAIASYDGVARSQTENINEYNTVNKWRTHHPLHHLADEEGDVTKWAFPENADLLQTNTHSHS